MKKLTFCFLLFFILNQAFGQNGITNQYQFNYLSLNPALAGENGNFSIKGILGNQFNGTIKPNQVSQILVIDGQLYNKSGLALQGFRNNSGNLTSTGLNISYSKGIEVGDLFLKLGANSGVIVQPNNIVNVSAQQLIAPFLGLGTIAHFKGVFLGVSKPMVIASKKIYEPKPIYLNIGYIFDAERAISFNANTLLAYDLPSKTNSLDINLKTWLFNRLGLGFSYRNNKILSNYNKSTLQPIVEYRFSDSFKIGLTYNESPNLYNGSQVPTNQIQTNGIFQLMFKYSNSVNDSKFLF